MSKHYILNESGEPVRADLMTWARWFEDHDRQRCLAQTQVTDTVRVSTVFLGLDHSWNGPPPLLWETMVFSGPLDQEQERYSTRADALAGHAAMVERARAAQH